MQFTARQLALAAQALHDRAGDLTKRSHSGDRGAAALADEARTLGDLFDRAADTAEAADTHARRIVDERWATFTSGAKVTQ